MSGKRPLLCIIVLLTALIGCGSDQADQKAKPAVDLAVSKPPAATSFATRVEFARYLAAQAIAGNDSGLLALTAPIEYVTRLRQIQGYREPSAEQLSQLRIRQKAYYRQQINTLISSLRTADSARLEYLDLELSRASDEEKAEISQQQRQGGGSDFGDVAIIIDGRERVVRLFRFEGRWYAASLGK